MATVVTASVQSNASARFSSTTGGISFAGSPSKDFSKNFTSTELTKIYFATLTVNTGGTTLDLTSLTDAFNNAVSFATVRELIIINNDTTNALTAGGGTSPVFAALPDLVGYTATSGSNGTCLHLTTNLTVDGTHKNLKLLAGAGSISVDVMILGV